MIEHLERELDHLEPWLSLQQVALVAHILEFNEYGLVRRIGIYEVRFKKLGMSDPTHSVSPDIAWVDIETLNKYKP